MPNSQLPAHYTNPPKKKKLEALVEVGRDFSDFLGDNVPVDIWRERREAQIAGKDAQV